VLRRSRFIWTPRQEIDPAGALEGVPRAGRREDGLDRWFLFRKSLDLPTSPERASLRIAADGRYRLYVNGEPVGRGPALADPHHLRLDRYDLVGLLQPGPNAIAIVVRVFGADTSWYEAARGAGQQVFGDGGLYVDGELAWGERSFAIQSDESWRCIESDAWERDTPRAAPGLAFVEVHDARLLPPDWAEPLFDDSEWDAARELVVEGGAPEGALAGLHLEPFPTLLERQTPQPTEQPCYPESLIRVDAVPPRPDLPVGRRPFEEPLVPLRASEDPRAMRYRPDSPAFVHTRPDLDLSLLLDFGRIHPGHPFFEIEAIGGECIDLVAAEGLEGEWEPSHPESPRLARGSGHAAHVLRYVARPGRQRFEAFEWYGLRYLQMVVRNAPQGLQLREVGSICRSYPAEPRGSFRCSDGRLERLWSIARDTLSACMVDGWVDGPARDRRQELGLAPIEFLAAQAAFGPSVNPLGRQLLQHGAESQRPDGLTRPFAPGDPEAGALPLPDRTLHWILGADSYLRYTGDLATIDEVFPAVQRALTWFELQIGPDDVIANLPYRFLGDRAAIGRQGESALLNALWVGALRAAARMARALDHPRAAARYEALGDRVGRALNARHWDAARGAYVDSVDPLSGRQDPRVSQHSNAALIAFEIAPRERWPAMLERISDPKRLVFTASLPVAPTGDELDLEKGVVLANTGFQHFVMRAYARAGRFDLALEAMRTLFGPMLDAGARTLWESWEPTASLCWGAAATPAYQLSTEVLGVKPLSDGFARIRIAPQLGDLAWAEGTFPTVRGDVRVGWRRQRYGLRLEVELPPGSEARLVPPRGFGAPVEGAALVPGKHDLHLPRD
jgi:hypothetical protein